MFKALSFLRTETSQHVSIVWFASVFILAGSQSVTLQATSEVVASCGDNVTLTCNATSSHKLDVKYFAWHHEKNVCQHDGVQPDPAVRCASREEASHHTLTLTLVNVMPVHEGRYLCKLQSNQGVGSAPAVLTVQDCLDTSESFINNSHAECWFSGVYPYSTVHWFQGDDNLTEHATTQGETDRHGRYNISSKMMVEKGNLSQAYNCSLWTHSDNKYVSDQELRVEKASSAGCTAQLQRLFMLVQIVLLKSLT